MSDEIKFGLRIAGDSSAAIEAVKSAKVEVENLTDAVKNAEAP